MSKPDQSVQTLAAGDEPTDVVLPVDHWQELVLLTIPEVAAALRMSEKTVRRRIKNGVIRRAPTGGRLVRISPEELRRLGADGPSESSRQGR